MKTPVEMILEVIKDRSLSIVIDNGKAVLRGDLKEVTPELLKPLKHWKSDVLATLGLEETAPVATAKPRLQLLYADGSTSFSDKADLRRRPTHSRFEGAVEWDEVPQ